MRAVCDPLPLAMVNCSVPDVPDVMQMPLICMNWRLFAVPAAAVGSCI